MSAHEEIRARLLQATPDAYQKTVGFPTYDILAAVALELAKIYGGIEFVRQKLDPEYLKGAELDRYILPRSGLERRPSTFAHGKLLITGKGTVEKGALFASAGGILFEAVENLTVSGENSLRVTCRKDGAIGNLPAHTVTQMPVTIPGITACDNPEPLSGGYDEESDAAYFQRHLIKVRTPPTSGNVYHYLTWALEIAGVGYAKVFPLGHGENTVDVVLVDSDGKPADADLVQNVQNYIDPGGTGEGYGTAPIGARCFVSAATARPITLSVIITKVGSDDAQAVSDDIRKAASAYFGSVAFQSDSISYAQVAKAILNVPGVLDFSRLRLDGDVENIAVGARECAVLGDCEVRYAV